MVQIYIDTTCDYSCFSVLYYKNINIQIIQSKWFLRREYITSQNTDNAVKEWVNTVNTVNVVNIFETFNFSYYLIISPAIIFEFIFAAV